MKRFYERFAKELKRNGVYEELCEHIRQRGLKKKEIRKQIEETDY